MSLYQAVLPEVFPWCAQVSDHMLNEYVTHLQEGIPEYAPNGSSYCVTSDCTDGYKILWLSDASLVILRRKIRDDIRTRFWHSKNMFGHKK